MLKEILTARTRPSDKALYNIWARKLSGGWTETTITGSLPLTFQAKGGDLTDYTVHGTAAGAGVLTESGEPEGYKIPLLLSGENSQSSNYNLYIGDSKLGADEYLDYGEQKVYKRTENLFEVYSDNAGRTTFEINGLTGVINRSEQSITVNKTSTARYPQVQLKGSQGVLLLVPNKTYTVSIDSSNAPENAYVYILIQGYINGGWQTIKNTRGIATDTFSFTENYANYRYILVMEGDGLTYNNTKIRISIVEGEVSSFIPYLQPTDPPAPLPAITAYQGENTMSSTETVGNVSVTGKIKEVTP